MLSKTMPNDFEKTKQTEKTSDLDLNNGQTPGAGGSGQADTGSINPRMETGHEAM